MQLNLNKKQRVNFSMMCKRVLFGVLFTIIVFSCCFYLRSVSVSASDVAEKLQEQIKEVEQPIISENQEERAEILLLHNEVLTDLERENLMRLSDMATSMVKSMEFGTFEQYSSYINDFSYIICYNLNKQETDLIEALQSNNAKVMIIGSDFLEAYLEASDQDGLSDVVVKGAKGTLQYSFSKNADFEELVRFDGIVQTVTDNYSSGIIKVGDVEYPFCTQIAEVRFVATTDFTGELSYAGMLKELAIWMWIYQNAPVEYVQYFVLDAVDAFMPAKQLKEKVELLIDHSISFVISVMPVYQNVEYPAMQQFCEVLKYAQDNGGAVIMHAPIFKNKIDDWEKLNEVMTDATVAYSDYGVYPLGIEIPQSWIYDKDMLEWLKRYRTVFVYQDEEESEFHENIHKNLIYYNYHNLIMPVIKLDDTGISYVKNYASAFYVKGSNQDNTELAQKIKNYMQSFVSTKSLWDITHSVWANNYHLSYEEGVLTINDEVRSISYVPREYHEKFNYMRNMVQRVTVNIKNQSSGLIFLVSTVTILFLIMIGYARYQNRKRFLSKKIKRKGK